MLRSNIGEVKGGYSPVFGAGYPNRLTEKHDETTLASASNKKVCAVAVTRAAGADFLAKVNPEVVCHSRVAILVLHCHMGSEGCDSLPICMAGIRLGAPGR